MTTEEIKDLKQEVIDSAEDVKQSLVGLLVIRENDEMNDWTARQARDCLHIAEKHIGRLHQIQLRLAKQ